MAKEEYENEEYENDEEDYEEDEEDEEEYSNPMLKRLYRQYDRLLDYQEKCEPGSQKSREINTELEQLGRTIASMEAAEHEKAERRRAEKEEQNISDSKIWDRVRTVSSFANIFIPIGVEMIRQKHEERKVDKITRHEDSGGIVKTAAIKWIK
jgi:hypothetical protein